MLRNERSVLDFLHQARQAPLFLMLVLFLFLLLLLFSLWFVGLWLRQGGELLVDSLQLDQEREANRSQQGNGAHKQTTTAGRVTNLLLELRQSLGSLLFRVVGGGLGFGGGVTGAV